MISFDFSIVKDEEKGHIVIGQFLEKDSYHEIWLSQNQVGFFIESLLKVKNEGKNESLF